MPLMFRKEKAFKFDRGRAIIRYSVYGRLFFENKGTISHRAVTQKRFRTARVRQRLGKQNASDPLIQKGREAFGHTSGVYLGVKMNGMRWICFSILASRVFDCFAPEK